MFQQLKLILLLYFIRGVFNLDQKYCDPALCTRWDGKIDPHIGCPGNAQSYCPPDTQEIEMTQSWIEYIVHKHNVLRNDLAGGRIGEFPAAKRMPLIQWDPELAYLAKLNMMRCIYGHDKCHNTQKFKWSGQNIAWSYNYPSDSYHIESMLDSWWNEYRDCPISEITKFGKSSAKIGHFTAMAQDRCDRI
uniref:CSON015468 protein n=1 Tax=Culicoides sonorensis TaxID=179676 RepID=A0A336KUT9_CULSO